MDAVEIYFGFHEPTPLIWTIRQRKWSMFGHVEAWGYTRDNTWFFFDPGHEHTILKITHHHDEVNELMARKFELCASILRIEPKPRKIAVPFHPIMTCAAQCGHLIGIRAYHPRTLHRILCANGATEIKHGTERERGVEAGA